MPTRPTPIVADWEYRGSGYLGAADALLAAGIEARLLERRDALYEERRGPPADES